MTPISSDGKINIPDQLFKTKVDSSNIKFSFLNYLELFLLDQFAFLKSYFTNGAKKKKIIQMAKKHIEEKLEFVRFFNNCRIIKNLND